jgi:hypothetical protein
MAKRQKKDNPRANWGAAENPRHCRNTSCKSIRSEVSKTRQCFNPARTLRYRICLACGQRYTTLEVL